MKVAFLFWALFLLENFLWILEVAEHILEVRAPILEDFRGFLETSLHLLENQKSLWLNQYKKTEFPPTYERKFGQFSFQMHKPRNQHR